MEHGLLTVWFPSICPSVAAWAHSSKPTTAGLLLRAQQAGNIDRLVHG